MSFRDLFKSQKDKNGNSDLSSPTKIRKNVGKGIFGDAVGVENENDGFREKVSAFSLDLRQIRPSAVFETRRNALRGKGFALVPYLWSFLKLREVGVSPYLSFIPILSVLQMFELNEAVRGRLIGPKSWNRVVVNF